MSAHTDSLVSGAREPFAEGLQTCHPSLPREMEVAVPCRVADQGQEQLFLTLGCLPPGIPLHL